VKTAVSRKIASSFYDSPKSAQYLPCFAIRKPWEIQFAGSGHTSANWKETLHWKACQPQLSAETPYFHGQQWWFQGLCVWCSGEMPEELFFLYYGRTGLVQRIRESRAINESIKSRLKCYIRVDQYPEKNSPWRSITTRNRVHFNAGRNLLTAWVFLLFFALIAVCQKIHSLFLQKAKISFEAFKSGAGSALIENRFDRIGPKNSNWQLSFYRLNRRGRRFSASNQIQKRTKNFQAATFIKKSSKDIGILFWNFEQYCLYTFLGYDLRDYDFGFLKRRKKAYPFWKMKTYWGFPSWSAAYMKKRFCGLIEFRLASDYPKKKLIIPFINGWNFRCSLKLTIEVSLNEKTITGPAAKGKIRLTINRVMPEVDSGL